jgi:hypothetical protein
MALGLKERDKSSLLPYRAGGEVDHVIQADFLGCEDNINHQACPVMGSRVKCCHYLLRLKQLEIIL